MANHRMIDFKTIDTDNFLDMPSSTQALYFHLIMRADDDGFVSAPKKITKLVNCGDDDLRLLIAKGYLIPFDSGVCVVTHWKVHNYIRKDRYQTTNYSEEFKQLYLSKGNVYLLSAECQPIDNQMTAECQPNVGSCYSYSNVIDKLCNSKDIESTTPDGETANGSDVPSPTPLPKETKHKHGMYNNVLFTDTEFEKLKSEFPNDWSERIERLSEYIASTGRKYKSHLATIRSWAKNDKTTVHKNQQPDYSDVNRYKNLKME